MINAECRRVNIGFIYVGSIGISSFAYIGLFGLVIPNTGIDELVIIGILGHGGGASMSMGGALEFIQSFNNPKIIDAQKFPPIA